MDSRELSEVCVRAARALSDRMFINLQVSKVSKVSKLRRAHGFLVDQQNFLCLSPEAVVGAH